MQQYRQLADTLAIIHGCLLHGSRVVIPASLRHQVLEQLHLGHFGMQRMKQLARSAVYWPNIDDDCYRGTTANYVTQTMSLTTLFRCRFT